MVKGAERIAWIDFGKGLAMLAVIIDHICRYERFILPYKYYTIFSVTSFVLLSGINTGGKIARESTIRSRNSLPSVYAILVSYSVATLVYTFYNGDFVFNLEHFLRNLFYFKASGPFYFIFFLVQLLLISRLLYGLTVLYDSRIYHILLLTATYALSKILQDVTFMLPLTGGGKYLFGGSYLFAFHSGMVLSIYLAKIAKSWIFNAAVLGLSAAGLIFLALSRYITIAWSNPPNAYAMIYTFCVVLLIMSTSHLLHLSRITVVDRLTWPIRYIGRNSLHVYLYHLLFIQIAWKVGIPSLFPIGGPLVSNLFWLVLFAIIPPLLIHGLFKWIASISGSVRSGLLRMESGN
ncbi:MAG: acyltransferase family protein [Syntrophobacteraceae bacterium]